MFYALVKNEDYIAERVNLFIAMAPMVNLSHQKTTFIGSIAKQEWLIYTVLNGLSMNELWSKNQQVNYKRMCLFLPFMCRSNTDIEPVIYNEQNRLDAGYSKFPSTTSLRQIRHYAQLITEDIFKEYDYRNTAQNMEYYNQVTPPTLNIKNIKKTPIAIYFGKQDGVADPQDVRWLKDNLNPQILAEYKEIDNFDHDSFTVGKNMTYMQDCLNLIKKYNWQEKEYSVQISHKGDISYTFQ